MPLFSFLADSRCILCGQQGAWKSGLCEACIGRVILESRKPGPVCPRCSEPLLSDALCPFCISGLDRLVSLSWFHSLVKELLVLYKTGQEQRLRYFFARMVHESLVADKKGKEQVVLVPIPPRRGKLHRRGWDQVDLLCRTLHSEYGYEVLRLLKRKDLVQQKSLGLEERRRHMAAVLGMRKHIGGEGRNDPVANGAGSLVLIDDILTSGATLEAAAALVSEYSNRPVEAMVICRVI